MSSDAGFAAFFFFFRLLFVCLPFLFDLKSNGCTIKQYSFRLPVSITNLSEWNYSVGHCSGYTLGDAYIGWSLVSRIMICFNFLRIAFFKYRL